MVDDEKTVRQVASDLLNRFGFEVEVAADGEEALQVVERRGAELRLVLLDMTMPRMDGEQAYGAIRRLRSDLPVVLCSGYSEADAEAAEATVYDDGRGGAHLRHRPGTSRRHPAR